jgi:hypothetical protein
MKRSNEVADLLNDSKLSADKKNIIDSVLSASEDKK